MGIKHKLAQYREYKNGVKHCTFDPQGPGAVRIHLVPPRFRLFGNSSYIVILNGYYLLPLGYSWALLLSHFIDEVNQRENKMISEEEMERILASAVSRTKKVFRADALTMRHDLIDLLDVLFTVARGEKTDAEVEKLSIRAYAKRMSAPHRFDLMVRAMTDADGKWQCNQKCLFCYAAGEHYAKTRELSTQDWKRIIDKLRSARVPMLTFTGGEPTQREDLVELVAYAKWFVTRLNTNGVNLTPALVGALKDAELDSLQVTLYSSEREIHNELVGSTHFEDTVRGIENALRAGLDVSVNTPLCRRNADYLSTLQMLHRMGVRFVTASGLICTGTAFSNHESYDLSKEELTEIVRRAKAFCDENGMEIDFTSPGLIDADVLEALGMNIPMCGAALSNMAVAPDGTALPCQSWLSDTAGLGNLLTDPFQRIWNRRLCKKLRKMAQDESMSCPFRTRSAKESHRGKQK